MAKIGIMGGTFDPIHLGHMAMAREAMLQADLDRVLFMPSKIPPHKRGRMISDEEQRAEMVRLAIQNEAGFEFSAFELARDGITYTAETLQLFHAEHLRDKLYFIMGGDSFMQLEEWYQPEKIMASAVILAVSRDGLTQEQMQARREILRQKYQAEIQIIQMPQMDISSTEIRKRVCAGRAINDLVPEAVAEYIQEQGIYCSGDDYERKLQDAGRD